MAQQKPVVLTDSTLKGYVALGALCVVHALVLLVILPGLLGSLPLPAKWLATSLMTALMTFGVLMITIGMQGPSRFMAVTRTLFFVSLFAFIASTVWWVAVTGVPSWI